MLSLFLFFVLAIFHREIFLHVIKWLGHAKGEVLAKEAAIAMAEFGKRQQIVVMENPLAEIITVKTWGKTTIFVASSFFESLEISEREALFIWCRSMTERHWLIQLLAGPIDPHPSDRDVILTLSSPTAFVRLLEKAALYRHTSPPTTFGIIFGGLTLLGSPWFGAFPVENSRVKAYVEQLTRLQK